MLQYHTHMGLHVWLQGTAEIMTKFNLTQGYKHYRERQREASHKSKEKARPKKT